MNFIIRKIKEFELISIIYIMTLRASMLAGKFLLGLFIVRFLGLDTMGVYGLLLGIAAIFPMIARLGIFSSISRIAVGQPISLLTKNLYHYASGTLVIYAVLLPAIIILGVHFETPKLFILGFFVILFEHISADIFVLTNNLEKPKLANELLSLQSAVWIYLYIFSALLFPALRTLDNILLFWISGGILSCLIAIYAARNWPWKETLREKINLTWYKEHLHGAWRLYFGDIINALSIYLDRYLITWILGLEAAGIYVLFWQVTNAICNLVGASVLYPYRPRLIGAFKERNIELFNSLFRESASKSLILGGIMACVSAAIIPALIRYTNNAEALRHLSLFWFMLFAMMVRICYDICAYTMYARQNDALAMRNGLLKIFMTSILGWVILSIAGLHGAPVTTIMSEAAAIIVTFFIWTKKRDVK